MIVSKIIYIKARKNVRFMLERSIEWKFNMDQWTIGKVEEKNFLAFETWLLQKDSLNKLDSTHNE